MIQKSGAHQYGGGWAMRATKKRRVWGPNLHSAKVVYEGTRKTMRLCTKCLRLVKSQMEKPGKKSSEEIKEVDTSKATASA
jgi:ribosomal protein L28